MNVAVPKALRIVNPALLPVVLFPLIKRSFSDALAVVALQK